VATLLVAPLVAAYPAFAQAPTGFSQTATATAFAPLGGGADSYGVVGDGGVAQGVVSGSPINGSFALQEARSRSADGTSGTVQGSFTMTDAAGNSISGTMSGSFTMGAGGSNGLGSYSITGGTGAFAGVSGSGSFSEAFGGDGAPTLNFGGSFFNNPYATAAAAAASSTYNPYVYNPSTAVNNLIVPNQGPSIMMTAPNLNVAPGPILVPGVHGANCAAVYPKDPDPYSNSFSVTGERCGN